jgi:hypothetical protein
MLIPAVPSRAHGGVPTLPNEAASSSPTSSASAKPTNVLDGLHAAACQPGACGSQDSTSTVTAAAWIAGGDRSLPTPGVTAEDSGQDGNHVLEVDCRLGHRQASVEHRLAAEDSPSPSQSLPAERDPQATSSVCASKRLPSAPITVPGPTSPTNAAKRTPAHAVAVHSSPDRALPCLEHLSLSCTGVGAEHTRAGITTGGLQLLRLLPSVSHLSLDGRAVSASTLRVLAASMTRLVHLSLNSSLPTRCAAAMETGTPRCRVPHLHALVFESARAHAHKLSVPLRRLSSGACAT